MEIIDKIREKVNSLQIPPTLINIIIILAIAYIIANLIKIFKINVNYTF